MRQKMRLFVAVFLGVSSLLCLTAGRDYMSVEEFLAKGQEYERAMMWESAIAMYTEILDKEPNHAMAHYRIGAVWEKIGAMDYAVKSYQAALRANPDLTEARTALEGYYINRAVALRRDKQLNTAFDALQFALALNPSSSTAHLEMGQLLEEQGKADEAGKAYQKVIALEPDNSAAHVRLAAVYASQGQHQQAMKEFQEVLRLNPKDPVAYHGIGVAQHELGQRDEAVTSLQQAIRFYLIAGQRDKAQPAWELQKKLRAEKLAAKGSDKQAQSTNAQQKLRAEKVTSPATRKQ
ncbi:MAG: tetratricopeptide repeat protein [Candidatus Binatia bacterium]